MLTTNDLITLEEYDAKRDEFRKQAIVEKNNRSVYIGDHLHLMFENKITILYQIQEILRIEKIFNKTEIEEELKVYNDLIPSGNNLKITMLVEFPDVDERKQKLTELINIENEIFFLLAGQKIYPICNEDLARANDKKTSAVHFMRFEFNPEQITYFKELANDITIGCGHKNYKHSQILNKDTQQLLAKDFHQFRH